MASSWVGRNPAQAVGVIDVPADRPMIQGVIDVASAGDTVLIAVGDGGGVKLFNDTEVARWLSE